MLLLRREHIDRLFDMLIANRRFDTPFKITEYDGGMNFFGRVWRSPSTRAWKSIDDIVLRMERGNL